MEALLQQLKQVSPHPDFTEFELRAIRHIIGGTLRMLSSGRDPKGCDSVVGHARVLAGLARMPKEEYAGHRDKT